MLIKSPTSPLYRYACPHCVRIFIPVLLQRTASTLPPKSLPNPVPLGSTQVLQQNVPEGAVAVATVSEETDLMEGLGAGERRRRGEGFKGWGTSTLPSVPRKNTYTAHAYRGGTNDFISTKRP